MLQAPQIVFDPIKNLRNDFKKNLQQVDALIMDSVAGNEPLVQKIAQTLISAGGKRLRPLMCLASSQLVGKINETTLYLAAAVELIHVATLLHDDVVDESELRRGQKTANLIWGNKASILVGDFLFARAFGMMVKTGNINFLDILATASAKISEGEVTQLRCFNSLELSVENYLKITEYKTATLFSAASRTGALAAGADKDTVEKLTQFGRYFGLMYQIIDDVHDYTDSNRGKSLGDDFTEGKVTLPVLLAYQDDPDKDFWRKCFDKDCKQEVQFDDALSKLCKLDSFEKSMKIAKSYSEEAKKNLASFDSNVGKLLCSLVDSCLESPCVSQSI